MIARVEKLVRRQERIGIVANHFHVNAGKEIPDPLGALPGSWQMVFGLVDKVRVGGYYADLISVSPLVKPLYTCTDTRTFRQSLSPDRFYLRNRFGPRRTILFCVMSLTAPFVDVPHLVRTPVSTFLGLPAIRKTL